VPPPYSSVPDDNTPSISLYNTLSKETVLPLVRKVIVGIIVVDKHSDFGSRLEVHGKMAHLWLGV
jgi:hypothetical protein